MSDIRHSDKTASIDDEKLQRLRDRTDEIELIISGLTTVALFTLPGWLFETLSYSYSHRMVMSSIGANILLLVVPGLFYGLGFCFGVHLMIRAYWAGLIGLRSTFPSGVNWERTPGIGPLTRDYYKQRLPDLGTAITRADHAASALFAVISMIALGVIWMATLLTGVLVVVGQIGARTGQTNEALAMTGVVLMGLLVGLPLLLWFFDAVLGKFIPGLTRLRVFRGLVHGMARVNGWFWPQRLILPVQLTLQSNTRPFLVWLFISISIVAIVFIGQLRFAAWIDFTVSDEFRYLDDDAVSEGMRSTYYESLRSRRDRVRLTPMIDQFTQERAVMRVFLPYHPLRDNPLLDQQCPQASRPLDCFRQLWSVSLNGRAIDVNELIPTERMDINLRGLTGVVPLAELEPGLHRLEVVWNPSATEDDVPIDDIYEVMTNRYQIPFMFAPAYEMGINEDS